MPPPRCAISRIAVRILGRPARLGTREDAINLGGHDEIVLVQSLDLFRAQRDRRISPAETDVGMVTLRLGKFADLPHEGQRLAKIAEPEASLDAMRVLEQFPLRSVG